MCNCIKIALFSKVQLKVLMHDLTLLQDLFGNSE